MFNDVDDGHFTLFTAFTGDADFAVMWHVLDIKAECFVDTEAAAIEEGEEGAVALADPIFLAKEVCAFKDVDGLSFL